MTLVFFLLSLIFALAAYNLYRPNRSHPKLNILSFAAGLLVGEAPLHHIIWQLGLVFIFVWAGVATGFLGALSLLICVFSWAAMGHFFHNSYQAKDEVKQALIEGLGPSFSEQIEPRFRARFPLDINYQQIINPTHPIDPQVERLRNLAYGQHDQRLDLYRRSDLNLEDKSIKRPVLLQIHGGAWTEKMGSKNEQALPLMNHMALRDWIVVSADYRLSPTNTFPDHIVDCKQALVWIKHNIAAYGGDPDFVVVTGGSAGGHLCSLLGLTANDPIYQPGFEDEDTGVQGIVSFYGVYDFTDDRGLQKSPGLVDMLEDSIMKLDSKAHHEAYQLASPLSRIHADAPPFFIIHGDKDSLVPVEMARVFADELREVSEQTVVYSELSGAQHAFDLFASVRSEYVKQGVEQYLAWLYSHHLNKS